MVSVSHAPTTQLTITSHSALMKRPWQIWLLFCLGLAVVVPAMGWLTVKALELDRAESVARRQAELEEDVSRALWRMDSLLSRSCATKKPGRISSIGRSTKSRHPSRRERQGIGRGACAAAGALAALGRSRRSMCWCTSRSSPTAA